MSKKAADTATSVAATIAIEQHFPRNEGLLDDDLAGSMLPLGSKVFVSLFRFAWIRNWVIRMTEKRFPGVAILANDVVGTRDAVGERRRVKDGLSKLSQRTSDLVRDLVLVARGFRLVVNAKD